MIGVAVASVACGSNGSSRGGQFQGAAKAFESSLSNLAVLLVIAVMVVYTSSGSCTRATSIHSRFSRGCRRRRSARS
jgi:hypothetical protein